MFRFIFGFLSLKFILFAGALWFGWSTLGTGWTLLIAYGLAAYMLWKWGPDAPKDDGQPVITMFPTRGRAFALLAPLLLCAVWPIVVILWAMPQGGPRH